MPFHLNDKRKAEQTEKSPALLGSIKEGRIRDKLLPPGLERQVTDYGALAYRAETHEWKQFGEAVSG